MAGNGGGGKMVEALFNRSLPEEAGVPRGERRLPRDQFQHMAGSADISR